MKIKETISYKDLDFLYDCIIAWDIIAFVLIGIARFVC